MPEKKKMEKKTRRTFKHAEDKPKRKPSAAKPVKKKVETNKKPVEAVVEVIALQDQTTTVHTMQSQAVEVREGNVENMLPAASPQSHMKENELPHESDKEKQEIPENVKSEESVVTPEINPSDESTKEHTSDQENQAVVDEEVSEKESEPEGPAENVTLIQEGGGLRWLLILIILFLIGLIGGFLYLFVFQAKMTQKVPTSPLKTIAVYTPTPTLAAVAKSTYTIQVLNGSGTSGQAATGRAYLNRAGYNVAAIGNAANQSFTQTQIQAKSSVSKAFIASLQKDLSSKYSVTVSLTALDTSSTTDVVVTIGSNAAGQ